MNCYNGDEFLREAIDSIYAQTYSDWEIIFWDNVSTDNSSNIAKSYDNRLKYHCSNATTLLGEARNLAINKANGEYIAFLDCDDLWLPEKLEKQMELIKAWPELGLVYSNCIKLFWPSNKLEDKFLTLKNGPYRGNVLQYLFLENFIPMLTVVVKKSILLEAGGFYEKLNVGTDYDLWFRIAQNYSVDYVQTPLAKYRIHDNSVTQMESILACKEHLRVLNRCLVRNPLLKKNLGEKLEKRISYKYLDLSSVYLKKYQIKKSLTMLFKALILYPRSFYFFLQKVKALINRKVIVRYN